MASQLDAVCGSIVRWIDTLRRLFVGKFRDKAYETYLRTPEKLRNKIHRVISTISGNLTFIGPCITNMLAEYRQLDAVFLNLFISVRRSTCFRRVFRPSSGAQNCT